METGAILLEESSNLGKNKLNIFSICFTNSLSERLLNLTEMLTERLIKSHLNGLIPHCRGKPDSNGIPNNVLSGAKRYLMMLLMPVTERLLNNLVTR
jgi:hypothetical protein